MCSLFIAADRTRRLTKLSHNLQDFGTRVFKIQDLKMVQTLVRARFHDANFILQEFETHLIFLETQ